jgi:glycerol uptake facilitator-like aquaporin
VVAHFVLRNAVGDPLPAPGTFGNFTTVNFAWGFGVVMGVYVAGGVSGAHINPAVTTSLALRRGFPWAKVGPYIVAQVLGAFVAALLIRWNFYEWFNQVDRARPSPPRASTRPRRDRGPVGPGRAALRDHRHGHPGDADPGHHRRAATPRRGATWPRSSSAWRWS